MSERAKSTVKENQKYIRKVIPLPIEKIICAARMKIRDAWSFEVRPNGIRIYGDIED